MDKRGELQSTLRIEDVPTVRSMVAQKLREAIMSGTLKPGQRLRLVKQEPFAIRTGEVAACAPNPAKASTKPNKNFIRI